jgi:Uma2 family endonuclease
MADTASRSNHLTLREFLEWEERQPRKYELLDGLVKMMTGGTLGHNHIALNIPSRLKEKLRSGPCRPENSDTKVVAAHGQSFYPDCTVDCGPFDPLATQAAEPTIVFEVLSPSTRDDDLSIKLPSYQATPSIRQIVYVEPNRVHLLVWERTAEGWIESEIVHPEASLQLAVGDATLTMAEIYEDLGY